MRFHLGSFVVGIAAYWAVQHFTGLGTSGKGKTA